MKARRIVSWVVLCAGVVGVAQAAPIRGITHRAKPQSAKILDTSQRIDVNNISMIVTNAGSFAYDKTNGAAGLEFPKGTEKTAVFAAGLWVGAKVAGQVRVAVAEYSNEYGPGAVVAGVADDPDKAEYKIYKLNRVYEDTTERDVVLADYNAGAVPHGAPVVTVESDGSLSILGDQMLWAVYNDLDPGNHSNQAGNNGLPAAQRVLGLEIQQTTFAFQRQGALGNTIFIKYRFINKGGNTLDSMFVSQWSDPDLGGFTDDLVGCDPSLGLGYVYNSTNNDEQYGGQPPALGYDFFKGPTIPGPITLGMASFNKYINGTDPNTALKSYNYMKGLDADGNTVINPVTGTPTTFQNSGDPVTGSGWLDSNPGDRRLMLSSGPFTMASGDTQEVVAAIVVGQSRNRLSSISLMKFYDTFAQSAFDANFVLPSPPNSPKVIATARHGSVFLTWDRRAENYSEAPYQFEGYVIYQGASISGPFTRIATYDRVDGITNVIDDDFNEDQGLILPTGKAFGSDVGLRYSTELTQDAVRGGPLYDGQKYFYAVTAYSVDVGSFPKVLESSFVVIPVVPQTASAGTDLASANVSDITQGAIAPGPTPTTDNVSVTVVDPATLINASYTIGFKPDGTNPSKWYLIRTVGTQVDTVINNAQNYSGDDEYAIVDGIQVKITSKPPGVLASVAYVDTAGGNPTPFEGVDRGLEFYGGGGGYAANDAGSTIADGDVAEDVTIRFSGGPTLSQAYHYLRNADGSQFHIIDFAPVPFEAYNTGTPATRYAVGFLETAGTASEDGVWDPSTAGNGGREAIFVFNKPYSDTPDPTFFSDSSLVNTLDGNLDIFYEVFPRRPTAGTIVDAGDKYVFTTSVPATANDFFTFSTTAANRSDATAAKAEMSRILAVPNPYFAHSTYETNQFNRILKFTHLPARCTIRIFNLAGDKVRTLEKNDDSSQASWDLLTDQGLPVGSGIYVFHVDAPGFGAHVGKLAVFMEKERLRNF